ncbi:MAG TPA: hypothetical protein VF729_00660 [Solirubrobacterales bacterium]
MTEQRQKPGDGSRWAGRASIAGALVAFFLVVRDYTPENFLESWPGIVLGTAILAAAAFGVVVEVMSYLAAHGRSRRPHRQFHVVAAFVVSAVVVTAAGVATGMSTAERLPESRESRTSARYARALERVFAELRDAIAEAQGFAGSGRSLYVNTAWQLSASFDAAAAALREVRVRPADERLHRRLVDRLDGTGSAYEKLALAVGDRFGSQGKIESAREGVSNAGRRLRSAQEDLARNGYRLVLRKAS